MRPLRLILREIAYRKLNFALGVLSVAVAVGSLVGGLTLLRSHDTRTEALVADKEQRVMAAMSRLQDDFRKLTLKMGFTTVIVHKEQDLAELYAQGFASRTMPEAWGDLLAARKVVTVNHLLPTLQQRLRWKERGDAAVQLIGTKGEVWIQGKGQRPLLEAVPPGSMVIGKELQRTLKLNVGDQVQFSGRPFTITGIRPGRGGADDIGVWIDLRAAQEVLSLPGQINAILAVDCNCPGDRAAVIHREISAILPDIRIYEFTDVADARSAARQRVAALAQQSAQQERQGREALRRERQTMANLLVPTAILACVVWVAFLTFTNVRDRGAEIGILRAVGLRWRQILGVFLGKALLMGLAGAVMGYFAGVLLGIGWESAAGATPWRALANPRMALLALMAAPAMALLAAALPALRAAWQDPAALLREE